MMRTAAILVSVLLASTTALPAMADEAVATTTVALGPAVQAREGELGRDGLQRMEALLRREVAGAAARSGMPIQHIELVIEDIQPNRPTTAQLGRVPGLSARSFGLGGAAVSGRMTVGGAERPIRFRFFQDNPRDETNFDTWGDASQAFEMLSQQVAHGQAPYDDKPWPAPHRSRASTGTRIPG